MGLRSTPAGSFGASDPIAQRRMHDVEGMLADREVKIDRMTSKLTETHQEVQRLRAQLEARDKDLSYTKRLVERVKKDQSQSQAEAEAHKDMVRRMEARLMNTRATVIPGGGDHNTAVLAERVQRLTARLQQEQEGFRTQKREVVRLQEEIVVHREALDARGEVGALQREVVQGRSEAMQLALQVHDAKEAARAAESAQGAAVDDAAAQRAEASELRHRLAAAEARGAQLEAELGQSNASGSKLQTENHALAGKVQQLGAELAAASKREAELAEVKRALEEGAVTHEHAAAGLRADMAQREEEFQVELGLFAERHDELRKAAAQGEAEAAAEKLRAEQLATSAAQAEERGSELLNEVGNLNAALDALTEQNAQLQRDYAELSSRFHTQAADLNKASASLAVTQETGDARHAMLTGRLEAALRELQARDAAPSLPSLLPRSPSRSAARSSLGRSVARSPSLPSPRPRPPSPSSQPTPPPPPRASQSVLVERDSLKASLEEALSRCASSVVAQQLAEATQQQLQQQLVALRQQATPVASPSEQPR